MTKLNPAIFNIFGENQFRMAGFIVKLISFPFNTNIIQMMENNFKFVKIH